MISIIIVNYKSQVLIEKCLASIDKFKEDTELEYIIVDNSLDFKNDHLPQIKLIRNEKNLGFSNAVNKGIRQCHGDYILLANPDTTVQNNVFKKMINVFADNHHAGIVGANLISADGQRQACQGKYPTYFTRFLTATKLYRLFNYGIYYKPRYKEATAVDWVSAGFMMIKKEVIDKIGLFDDNFFMYYEDLDFCYRAHLAGYEIIFLPQAEVIHISQASFKGDKKKAWSYAKKSFQYYCKKYKK